MNNQKIARVVADLVYKPKNSEEDTLFAVQLLVEKLFIPKEIESYGLEQIENYLLSALDDKESMNLRYTELILENADLVNFKKSAESILNERLLQEIQEEMEDIPEMGY